MTTNADLTLYNYWYNPEMNAWEYRKTQIQGVHWYAEEKTDATEKGVVCDTVYKIRLPDDAQAENGRTFMEARLYHMLSPEQADLHWTVDKGDLFAKGLLDVEAKSLASLKGYESGKVKSYSINSFGTCPHIRIGGVG